MNCYLCHAELTDVLADKNTIRFGCYGHDKKVMRCSCGLVQLVPQWTSDELDELYREYSSKMDFPGQKRKVKISKYLTKYIRKGEYALEVGCGHGDNLAYLASNGISAIGIDKERGIDYKDFTPDPKPDVIYAIHLFEHLDDPKEFIKWMIEHSHRFILEMPCINDVLMGLPAYQKFCWYPYHLFFYTKGTIGKMFGNVEIIRRQEYGIVNHLRWFFLGRPGNWNPHIPILDSIYKGILTRLGYSDTLIVVGNV